MRKACWSTYVGNECCTGEMISRILFIAFARVAWSQCVINAKFCAANRTVPPYYFDSTAAVFGSTACTLTSGYLRNFGCEAFFVPTNASINYTPEPICLNGAWSVSSPTPADPNYFTCIPGPACPYVCGPSPAACKDNITSGEVPLGGFVSCAAGYAPTTVPYCAADGQQLTVSCTSTPNTVITSAPAWLRWAEATSNAYPTAFSYGFTATTCNSMCGYVSPSVGPACRSDSYTCSACMNCSTTPQASQLGSLLDTIQVRGRSALAGALRQTYVGLVQITCTGVTEDAHRACLAAAACDGYIVDETVCVVGGRSITCPGWSVGVMYKCTVC